MSLTTYCSVYRGYQPSFLSGVTSRTSAGHDTLATQQLEAPRPPRFPSHPSDPHHAPQNAHPKSPRCVHCSTDQIPIPRLRTSPPPPPSPPTESLQMWSRGASRTRASVSTCPLPALTTTGSPPRLILLSHPPRRPARHSSPQ
ncbi:WAS/WASL-interacting protein family member 3-like [Portunus trituberculatus]|uniref:WAS/WASL-interacting protein family member 3-like n=1 Tax=Portunus trituberculatus TaxID=210409 RepID=UPI001E1CE223|nr:WAS/WASL-interacting protein family member 3-like [Portunus trituberculatus]